MESRNTFMLFASNVLKVKTLNVFGANQHGKFYFLWKISYKTTFTDLKFSGVEVNFS